MRYRRVLHNFKLYSKYYPFKCNNLLDQCAKFSVNSPRIMSTNSEVLEQSRTILKDMFLASVKAVSPVEIIRSRVRFTDGILQIEDETFEIGESVYLVGFGKAVMGMALALEQILGDSLKKGIISVPAISTNALWESDMALFPKLSNRVIEFCEGSLHNQPDERSLETTHNILDMVEQLAEKDTLIVLASGGGSALLYMPRPVIDQDDKLELCKTLQNAGADIKELNTVRQKLSLVKGGGLARAAYPAQVISLILSDIVGDPVDLIASGPTVYSPKTPETVVEILRKYKLFAKTQGDVRAVITAKETFDDKALLDKKNQFKHVHNIIIGNNSIAIKAAADESLRKKIVPVILRNDIAGNVRDVSLAYAYIVSLMLLGLDKVLDKQEFFDRVRNIPILPLPPSKVDEIYEVLNNINGEGLVLIAGGEPTVVVTGSGKGGRNQELALYFALDWLLKIKEHPKFAEYDVIMLSGGTDGQDGPTDATGAFGYAGIGPEVYNLYRQMKIRATQESARVRPNNDTIKEAAQKPEDSCKLQELSGYLKAPKKPAKDFAGVDDLLPLSDVDISENINIDDVHPIILQAMEVERMLPENALKDNDSYNFYSRFKKGANLLKTGLTGSNVMDLHFIYIKKRNCDCKVDFTKEETSENVFEEHDLHIDPSTFGKYKTTRKHSKVDWERPKGKHGFSVSDKVDKFNIKIIDDNLREPCCRKERKYPTKTYLKTKKTFYNELLPE